MVWLSFNFVLHFCINKVSYGFSKSTRIGNFKDNSTLYIGLLILRESTSVEATLYAATVMKN